MNYKIINEIKQYKNQIYYKPTFFFLIIKLHDADNPF